MIKNVIRNLGFQFTILIIMIVENIIKNSNAVIHSALATVKSSIKEKGRNMKTE
jgi:hypothetical protein